MRISLHHDSDSCNSHGSLSLYFEGSHPPLPVQRGFSLLSFFVVVPSKGLHSRILLFARLPWQFLDFYLLTTTPNLHPHLPLPVSFHTSSSWRDERANILANLLLTALRRLRLWDPRWRFGIGFIGATLLRRCCCFDALGSSAACAGLLCCRGADLQNPRLLVIFCRE